MSAKPTTYQDLLDIQERLVQQGALNARTAANRASTLRVFLAVNKLEVAEPVGEELRALFNERCREFSQHLKERGTSLRNLSNLLSTLRSWRKLIVSVDTERAIAGDNLAPFNQAVRSVLKDYSVTRLARELHIPRDMLFGWLRGKRPRISNARFIYRIENFFGLPHGELVLLAGISGAKHIQPKVGESTVVGYREALAERVALQYLFKPEPDSPLRVQWYDYMRYKTDWEPVLARSGRGVWRTAPFVYRRETATAWAQYLDGLEVPSAKMAWTRTASYLGWLNLAVEHGGCALDAQSLHTLAWFAVKKHVDAYIRWMVKRNGNQFNGSVLEFFSMAMSLLRVGTGYLAQQPEMLATLPASYAHRDWAEMCQETFVFLRGLSARFRKSFRQTRDPKEPMRPILDLENPLDMVADMIQRMRADRPVSNSPWKEAVWARDLALVKIMVSNPLRLRNIATLTWCQDNTGQLYQRPDGSWWIRIDKNNFKNARGAAGDTDYDMPVQEMAWGDLERYLKVFRPRLLQCNSDYVFVAARHGSTPLNQGLPWSDISSRLETLTRKYLWRCPGIRAHAFRHLVATAVIKASKLSDFKTAALILNDRMSTVEKHYGHLRSSDGANRMAELLEPAFRRM